MADEIERLFMCILASLSLWKGVCYDPLPIFRVSYISTVEREYYRVIHPISRRKCQRRTPWLLGEAWSGAVLLGLSAVWTWKS